jgi:hypothetical protein
MTIGPSALASNEFSIKLALLNGFTIDTAPVASPNFKKDLLFI